MAEERQGMQDACFIISVAARLVGVHEQTLRYYERSGLLNPSRSKGNIRLYSRRDLERATRIKELVDELGVNLAGVEVIIRLTERMREMDEELTRLREENRRLKQRQTAIRSQKA
jgi:MerR family transcriptional regulator/heat shock protein HspR